MSNIKDMDERIVIDSPGSYEVLINGRNYDLVCSYHSDKNNNLINVYFERDGADIIMDFGNGTAGRYSIMGDDSRKFLDYIEATVSLKVGFDLFSDDFKKFFIETNSNKKHPIVFNMLEFKDSLLSKISNYYHRQQALSRFNFDSFISAADSVYTMDYSNGSQAKEYALDDEPEESLKAEKTKIRGLPDGWHWAQYKDGSGHLESPKGKRLFAYDANVICSILGSVEYKKTEDSYWTMFWGSFDEFKAYAEDSICKECYCLDKFNIPSLMNTVEQNAWSCGRFTSFSLVADSNVIDIRGYIYEPSYECFSVTSSISLNGEILYGKESRNTDAYRYETYQTGLYDNVCDALSHIKNKIKGQELVLLSEKSKVDEIISDAKNRVENNEATDKCFFDKSRDEAVK